MTEDRARCCSDRWKMIGWWLVFVFKAEDAQPFTLVLEGKPSRDSTCLIFDSDDCDSDPEDGPCFDRWRKCCSDQRGRTSPGARSWHDEFPGIHRQRIFAEWVTCCMIIRNIIMIFNLLPSSLLFAGLRRECPQRFQCSSCGLQWKLGWQWWWFRCWCGTDGIGACYGPSFFDIFYIFFLLLLLAWAIRVGNAFLQDHFCLIRFFF